MQFDERTIRFITNGWGSDANFIGEVESEPKISYSTEDGIDVYEFTLRVERLSKISDHILILAKKETIEGLNVGDRVKIVGIIQSYDLPIDDDDPNNSTIRKFEVTDKEGNPITVMRKRWFLKIYVFAKKIEKTDDETDENLCHIDGVISSKEELRRTDDGKTVLRFKVTITNRHLKSHVYCVAWNNVAQMIYEMRVGDSITAICRMQSWDNPRADKPGYSGKLQDYKTRRLELSTNYLLNRLKNQIYGNVYPI